MSGSKSENHRMAIKLGYSTYIMPRDAAMAFLNACHGGDFYKVDSDYVDGQNVERIQLLTFEQLPTFSVVNPALFLLGLENQEKYEQRKEAERKAKEAMK